MTHSIRYQERCGFCLVPNAATHPGEERWREQRERRRGEESHSKNLQIEYNLINLPQSISNGNSSTTYYGYLVITTTEQYVAKRQGDINNNDRTREDHKGNIKILTSKDYVSIFGSDIPQKVNDENNYLILIYLHNTWK